MSTLTTAPDPKTHAVPRRRSDIALAAKAGAISSAVRPRDRSTSAACLLREAEPDHAAEESGHVCRGGGRGA